MASAQSWLNQNFATLNHPVLGFISGVAENFVFSFVMPREKTRVLSLENPLEKLETIVETLTEWLAESDVLLQLPPGKSCFPPEQRLVNASHSPPWGKSSFEAIRAMC
jgi:hypothetical protein